MSFGPERIAVTGVGLVSALGRNAPATFSRLIAGERGFARVTLFDAAAQRTDIVGEVQGIRVEDVAVGPQREAWSRSDALGVIAAQEALAQAGLAGGCSKLGVALGATTGGMHEAETVFNSVHRGTATRDSLRRLLSYPLSTTARRITEVVAGVCRTLTLCSACSSGALAIAQGAMWLELGLVDRALVGGVDGLSFMTLTGFNSLAATAVEVCRPFDVARAGLTLAEGGGFLVLEAESSARQRGATVLAWLTGWAAAAEAHHMTQPEPSGATAALLLRDAMRKAGLTPDRIDYVNAHGTATVHNDAMEARALEQAFGDETPRIYVSSSKGQIGHTLGAAGAIEAAITVLSIQSGVVPPTGGLEQPDPGSSIRHVIGHGEKAPIRAALSSSFGFGGTGCVLAFEHSDAEDRREARVRHPLVVTGVVTLGPRGTERGVMAARVASELPSSGVVLGQMPGDPLTELDPGRSRRFDRAAALVTLGAQSLLQDASGLEPAHVALAAGTAFGSVQRSLDFLGRVADKGPALASPAEFPHLLPSAGSGNASIYVGIKGPAVTAVQMDTNAEAAVATACDWLCSGLAAAAIGGSADPHDDFVERFLSPLHATLAQPRRSEGAAWLLIETETAAAERGGTIMASLRERGQCVPSEEEPLRDLAAPHEPERALVVVSGDTERCESILSRCTWSPVERRSVAPNVGTHEGAGGVALAAAAALVASGVAHDVLVLSCGTDQIHWYWFAEPSGSLVRRDER